jgi:hypothetical protein
MGVDLSDPPHERVPSFTLGIADVSPLEMASAYADVAGARQALREPAREADPEQRGQGLQELQEGTATR